MLRSHSSSLLSLSRRLLISSPKPLLPLFPSSSSSLSFSSLSSSSLSRQLPISSYPSYLTPSLLRPPTSLRWISRNKSEGNGHNNPFHGLSINSLREGVGTEKARSGFAFSDEDIDHMHGEEEEGEEEEEEPDPIKRVTQKTAERTIDHTNILSPSLSSSPLPGPEADLIQDLLSSSSSLSSPSLSSEIDSLLNQVEGLPNDPLGFAEIAKFLELDANKTIDPADKERLEEMKNAIKKPIEAKFKAFIELLHGKYDGDDRALSLFAATAIHAQLFGPTKKNDMESVSRVLPFLKSMLFTEEKSDSEKTDFEQAIGETSRKEMEILSSILDQVKPERLRIQSLKLSDLKYTKLYPKVVLQWVLDAKTPYGMFGENGYWVPEPVTTETISRIKEKQLESARRYATLRADDDILDNAIPVFPHDLAGHFRFNLTKDEVESMKLSPKTLQVLSFAHANQGEINKFRIKKAVERWGRGPGDTGSDEVQAAILTEKMFYLSVHFRNNPNDKSRKRMFLMMLARRQRLLRRLKREKTEVYYALLKELQIPDTVRSYSTGFLPGLSVPKQSNISRQKRQRLLKGKVISQRAHDLAARRPKAKA